MSVMLLMMDLFVNVFVGAVVNIPVTTVTDSSSSIGRPLSEPTAVVRLVESFQAPPPSGSDTVETSYSDHVSPGHIDHYQQVIIRTDSLVFISLQATV